MLGSHNRQRIQIKWLKTRLFELLPHSVAFAMFLDSDMIVERPLRHLLDDCFARHKARPVITLYRDFGNTGMPYHTGVLFVSRQHSTSLLRAWGDTMMQGYTKSDQKCINQTIAQHGWRERVQFLDVNLHNFAFINGSIVNGGERFTLLHATFYRLSMADKFNFTREQFTAYLRDVAQLAVDDAGVLSLVPDADEVLRRQAERAKQQRKGTRNCRYIETAWHGFIIR